MSTTIVSAATIDLAEAEALDAMSTADLRRELAEALHLTAHSIARLAAIWMILERRGEDLSALRTGLGQYLPAIARGRLLPEAVVHLAGNRTALRAVSQLDIEEQRRVLDARTLHVLRPDGPAHVPLENLTPSDVSRAIDTVTGRVLPVAAQRMPRTRTRRADPTHRIIVQMTRDEHDRVQKQAALEKKTAAALIMQVLRGAGVV